MIVSRRLIAAAIGLALPLVAATAAQAAPHRPAQVRTATYKVTKHKQVRQHHAALTTRKVAQAHRHSIMRGS